MNAISQLRFDALAGYSRRVTPTTEIEWYEVQNERILGVLVAWDEDNTFGGVALARDRDGRFRWIDGTNFFDELDIAREALASTLEKQAHETDESFWQGDEGRRPPPPLLTPIVSPDRQHPYFRSLIGSEGHSPAAGIIAAMSPYFRDLDGNFVEQFQTTAFDARIFELYVFAMLHEIGYAFDESENAPDYHCCWAGGELFVEAVTVQAPDGAEPPRLPTTREEKMAFNEGYGAIRYRSSLYSKLQKKYWELPHVAGKPLLIAIQDFHQPFAMTVTFPALASYLYGWRHIPSDENGRLVITPERIDVHRYGNKEIPSGFFALPGAEHISAVLHNPLATLSKFNRLGAMAGFGSKDVVIIHDVAYQDPNPDAWEPIRVSAHVRDPDYSEGWTDGLNVYHNPRALHPIDRGLFPNSAHHYIRADGMLDSWVPDPFPMTSRTRVFEVGRKV